MAGRPPARSGLLTQARRRLLRRERVGVFETPPDVVASWSEPRVPGVVLRLARADDARAMRGLLSPRAAARWLAAGDFAIVAEDDGRILGCAWVARRPIWAPYFRVRVRPGPGEGYGHALEVRPSARGRGIGSALVRAARIEARRRGVALVSSYVQLANRGAVAVQRSVGGVLRARFTEVVLLEAVGLVLSSEPVADGEGAAAPAAPAPRERLRRVRRGVVRRARYDLVHTPTDLVLSWKGAAPEGVEVRRATAADVRAMRGSFPPYMVRTFDYLLSGPLGPDGIREGQVGIVAVRDGRPIGCAWASSVPITLRHIAIRVQPAADEWYAYGIHILSEWKGSVATGRAIMRALLEAAHDAGARVVTGHVDLGNRFNTVIRRLGGVGIERSYAIVIANRRSVTLWRRRLG